MSARINMHESLVVGTKLPTVGVDAIFENALLIGVAVNSGWASRPRLRRLWVTLYATKHVWEWWPRHLRDEYGA